MSKIFLSCPNREEGSSRSSSYNTVAHRVAAHRAPTGGSGCPPTLETLRRTLTLGYSHLSVLHGLHCTYFSLYTRGKRHDGKGPTAPTSRLRAREGFSQNASRPSLPSYRARVFFVASRKCTLSRVAFNVCSYLRFVSYVYI